MALTAGLRVLSHAATRIQETRFLGEPVSFWRGSDEGVDYLGREDAEGYVVENWHRRQEVADAPFHALS